jgi:hypothetical protein
MAVVQISKIQNRRGIREDLPQLSGGEIAWAIDTQELFIGNGSVAEGSPYVGNTKILTEHDNILDLSDQYEYRKMDSTIQTSDDINYPIQTTLQSRLDQHITVASFAVINGTVCGDNLQRAIDQLFLNISTRDTTTNRYILEVGPGTYDIDRTIYIPSYCNLVGAGTDKVIFNFVGEGYDAAFRCVNDNSDQGDPAPIASATLGTQPKRITLKGFSIKLNDASTSGIILDAAKESYFEDIKIEGDWTPTVQDETAISRGISLNALSALVTSRNNTFNNITISGVDCGIHSDNDIRFNIIENCNITDSRVAVSFGANTDGISTGEIYGPRSNIISRCFFERIYQEGVLVQKGTNNLVSHCFFNNVGNDLGNSSVPIYNQIRFDIIGNNSNDCIFDRSTILSDSGSTEPYIAEVAGISEYKISQTQKVILTQTPIFTDLFRLPAYDLAGYEISYIYRSSNSVLMRKGTIKIALDAARNNLVLSDDYDFTGASGGDLDLTFSAQLVDTDGASSYDTIIIKYKNLTYNDSGELYYSFAAIYKNI